MILYIKTIQGSEYMTFSVCFPFFHMNRPYHQLPPWRFNKDLQVYKTEWVIQFSYRGNSFLPMNADFFFFWEKVLTLNEFSIILNTLI